MSHDEYRTQQWMANYIKEIETNYNIRITNNITSLLCRCDAQHPPEQHQCGKFPMWCLGFRCRSQKCRAKKKWYVCIHCINVLEKNKKMYRPKQLILHNQLHETFAMSFEKHVFKDSLNSTKFGLHKQPENSLDESLVNDATNCTNVASRISPEIVNNHAVVNPSLEKHLDYYRALEKGVAMRYVVNKQFALDNNISSTISTLSATLHTLIASVSFSQSNSESTVFAKLLYLINQSNNNIMQDLITERNYYR